MGCAAAAMGTPRIAILDDRHQHILMSQDVVQRDAPGLFDFAHLLLHQRQGPGLQGAVGDPPSPSRRAVPLHAVVPLSSITDGARSATASAFRCSTVRFSTAPFGWKSASSTRCQLALVREGLVTPRAVDGMPSCAASCCGLRQHMVVEAHRRRRPGSSRPGRRPGSHACRRTRRVTGSDPA